MKLFSYNRASKLMKEANIDILLPNTKTNVAYLAGYYSHFMNADFMLDDGSGRQYISFLGLPREESKKPFFTPNVGDGEDLVDKDIWIKDLYFYGDYFDYSYLKKGLKYDKAKENVMDCLVEAILERNLEESTIGVEMFRIPAGIFLELKKRIPKARFVDGTEVLWQLRMIKSSEEISRIERAAQITDKAMEKLFADLREGITELECEKMVKTHINDLGGDFVWTHIAFGPKSISLPTERKLQKNDSVRIDLGGGYKGYVCDFCRTKIFGDPGKEFLKIYDAVLKTQKTVKENIRPGIKCSSLYKIGKIEMKNCGFSLFLPYIGHGVGKDLHELPYLTEFNESVLKAGMVITIEIYYVNEDYTIAVNLEDQLLITDSGYEDLNFLNKEINAASCK